MNDFWSFCHSHHVDMNVGWYTRVTKQLLELLFSLEAFHGIITFLKTALCEEGQTYWKMFELIVLTQGILNVCASWVLTNDVQCVIKSKGFSFGLLEKNQQLKLIKTDDKVKACRGVMEIQKQFIWPVAWTDVAYKWSPARVLDQLSPKFQSRPFCCYLAPMTNEVWNWWSFTDECAEEKKKNSTDFWKESLAFDGWWTEVLFSCLLT